MPFSGKLEHMSYKIIKASEVAEYAYCQRAWWFSHVAGIEPLDQEARRAGVAHHQHHQRLVWQAVWGRRFAYVLVFAAVAIFAFLLVRGL
jgi:hypothetical protein